MDAGGRNRGHDPPGAERRLGAHAQGKARGPDFCCPMFLDRNHGPGCALRQPEIRARAPTIWPESRSSCDGRRQDRNVQKNAIRQRKRGDDGTDAWEPRRVRSPKSIIWPPDAVRGEAFRPRRGGDGSWQLGPGDGGPRAGQARSDSGSGAHRPPGRQRGPDSRSPPFWNGRSRHHPSLRSRSAWSVCPGIRLIVDLGQGAESGVVAPVGAGPAIAQVQHPLARCR